MVKRNSNKRRTLCIRRSKLAKKSKKWPLRRTHIFEALVSDEERLSGPIVLGVEWSFSDYLMSTAASLVATQNQDVICAYVDPASYLTEWEPFGKRTALSLDPIINGEAQFPSGQLRQKLEVILGSPEMPGLSVCSTAMFPRRSCASPRAPVQP